MGILRRIYRFLVRENLIRLLMLLIIMIAASTVTLAIVEPGISLVNAFWLSIVTLTTVGYGDITPTTGAGRFVGIVIMLFGIGILGMFTATIAGIFVEKKIKEDRGMTRVSLKDHVIICTWNHGTKEIINELRGDARIGDSPIVLIAELDHKPLEDENLFFINGAVTEENLKNAGLASAATIIILGDDSLDVTTRDARVVLSTLTIEAINPDVYSIVELVDEANVRHCQRAHADEIIVANEFSCRLISRTALDHGISKVVSRLLSAREGDDIYKIAIPGRFSGKNFLELFTTLKKENDCTVLALQKSGNSDVISNPPADLVVESGDHLIIIAKEKPGFE